MTATDELRRLLDERGMECRQTEWIDGTTINWHGSDGIEYRARNGLGFDGPTGRLVLYDLTPEQAIEATLGHRTTTRHGKWRTKYGRSVPCCECCGYGIGDERWHYCPSCGAEVVDE